jgi:hypothetical protein
VLAYASPTLVGAEVGTAHWYCWPSSSVVGFGAVALSVSFVKKKCTPWQAKQPWRYGPA